ncbi:helix-turn-helix domain-containing protein [Microcoleus sp. FACHB-SPT15]|uniref:helix-turn-helix domain-containing protein n=1 Tax=Microcoleus sp. FACHB-SPT15 TaxID=2692830 RepID=UPI001784D840|nr:helix-turn-helix domain-containing protein [Microcoleus sp. FACHB-SPT15]MBD1806178.1 helix-turn-helix domain-containing protein [Microcoleus sp. FACHB-SPT15]
MRNGRSFGEWEQQLLERFANRRPLALTPQQLAEKWPGISRNQIAMLCQTDISRVNRWLTQGRSQEKPSPYYSQTLALFDIFLEFHEQLPAPLISRYCDCD